MATLGYFTALCFLFRVFEKSMQYVKRFSRYKNQDAVRQVREYPSFHKLVGGLFIPSSFLERKKVTVLNFFLKSQESSRKKYS